MTARSLSASSLLALILAAGLAAPAFAQEGSVDAVIVTAQRVAEDIQDVPLSVTAIDAEKLSILASGGAAVFGRNITDDLSLEGGIDFNNLTGFINEPRTWGVEVKAKL